MLDRIDANGGRTLIDPLGMRRDEILQHIGLS